jgi:hypothetical protein
LCVRQALEGTFPACTFKQQPVDVWGRQLRDVRGQLGRQLRRVVRVRLAGETVAWCCERSVGETAAWCCES